MRELFEIILTLSALGSALIVLLLLLKPLTAKRFPARWQYGVWILALLFMMIPAYLLIPEPVAKTVPGPLPQVTFMPGEAIGGTDAPTDIIITALPSVLELEIPLSPQKSLSLWDMLSYLWLCGFCLFLLVIVSSYLNYIVKKRHNSEAIENCQTLTTVKEELGIRRQIRLRRANSSSSPLLVGIVSPTIYLPKRPLSDESLRMIYLHELTHYKRKDLLLKWLALFVNAVHWFNPLCYLLVSNFSQSCELSCDMAVTKNMTKDEQKAYMKTILDLVEERT